MSSPNGHGPFKLMWLHPPMQQFATWNPLRRRPVRRLKALAQQRAVLEARSTLVDTPDSDARRAPYAPADMQLWLQLEILSARL